MILVAFVHSTRQFASLGSGMIPSGYPDSRYGFRTRKSTIGENDWVYNFGRKIVKLLLIYASFSSTVPNWSACRTPVRRLVWMPAFRWKWSGYRRSPSRLGLARMKRTASVFLGESRTWQSRHRPGR